ncbi:hypothetical protein QEH52_05075 [Coraliomargarita sp. SDUM461003]|uniref:Uncharacterized protein n=1 Tax=Thalassobacterium maritimum TaxID=3041265 RepID=A0ABU1ART5_9BACT|nr:hypothetical protein [Coraliomargarita sp. SDUM461003]MDQ8206869.1 hypothetical protein [Coraliomargarita sp. SDUM461003]
MKYIAIVLTSLMLGVLGHASSNDQALWGKSDYGMTIEQVLEAFPDATMNPNNSNSDDGIVIISDLKVGIHECEVHFFIGLRGLYLVKLEPQKPNNSTFIALEKLLRLKYGKPVSIRDLVNIKLHTREWYDAPRTVRIAFLDQVDNKKLSIVYTHEKQDAINSL